MAPGRPKEKVNKNNTPPAPQQMEWDTMDPYSVWGEKPNEPTGNTTLQNGLEVAPLMQLGLIRPDSGHVSIEARITDISPLHEFERGDTTGTVFEMQLLDSSGQLRIACFNQDAEQEKLKINEKIRITNCYAKKNEGAGIVKLSTSDSSQFLPCETDMPEIPLKIVSLEDISSLNADNKFDVLVVCHKVGPIQDIPSHSPKYKKREIFVTDQSKVVFSVALWGAIAVNFEPQTYSVLILRGVTLKEFQNRAYINVNYDSVFWLNPTIDSAVQLLKWFSARISTPFPKINS